MAGQTVIRSFASGELSKALASRADLAVYASGLRRCRNWVVSRNGGVSNRAGTRFVAACKTTSENVRLIRYTSEVPGESVLIEFGEGYLRFHQNGAPLTVDLGDVDDYNPATAYVPGDLARDGEIPYYCHAPTTGHAPPDTDFWLPLEGRDDGTFTYEIPCPFTDPATTRWVQSGRLVTFTSHDIQAADLHYASATRWWFDYVVTTPTVEPPTNVAVTSDGTSSEFYEFAIVATYASGRSTAARWSGEITPAASGGNETLIEWDVPILLEGLDPFEGFDLYESDALIGTVGADDRSFAWDGTPGVDAIDEGEDTNHTPIDVTAEGGGADASVAPVRYVVTAIDPITGQESLASEPANADLPPPTTGNPHRISWDLVAVAGQMVGTYRVYVDFANGGPFLFLSDTSLGRFVNTGITPDLSRTPPTTAPGTIDPDDPATFPAVAGYFQQRRFFANTLAEPDRIRASRIGEYSTFTVSSPILDADAISFRLAGNNNHPVLGMVALKDLLVLTGGGEWRMQGDQNGALTPSAIRGDQETYAGIDARVPALVIGNTVVYVQARGKIVRDLKFDQQVQGLAGRDLTLLAAHLVNKFTMRAMDFQQSPDPIVWVCRSDGTLLGLTYLPELETLGWHRHDTGAGGRFEAVCIVPEHDEDAVYLVVSRVIGGDTVRYIERLASRLEARVFLDAAVDTTGPATSTVDGLEHLEGQVVAVYADGKVRASRTVASGAITLDGTYASIVVGLSITADLETLDLDAAGADIRGKKKRMQGVGLLLENSSRNFKAGPSATRLKPYAPASDTVVDSDSDAEELLELTLEAGFDFKGRVFIRQDKPTAMTILGLLPLIDVGA